MITSLYNLGKCYLDTEKKDKLELLITTNQKIDFVLNCELIQDSDGKLVYGKWFQTEYDPYDCVKYLYRKGSSRGTNITPSTLIVNVESTWNGKFFKWFENNKDKNSLFRKIHSALAKDEYLILNDLNILFDNIKGDAKNNILLSIVIRVDDEYYYLNDYNEFKNIIIENSEKSYYHSKSNKIDIKGEGICYCCEEHKTVYGLALSTGLGLKFATPEKIGNIPGNDLEEYWKTTPVCGDCTLTMNAGLKYVDEHLKFKEFGLNYYIIPKFLFNNNESFQRLNSKIKEVGLMDSSNELPLLENKISRTMNGLEDDIEFKFLFFQKNNSALDILSYVESTIPSWLNRLYSTQLCISKDLFLQEDHLKLFYGKDFTGDFITHLQGKLYKPLKNDWYKRFLKDLTNDNKEYLDFVTCVLSNNCVDYDYLLSLIVGSLRTNFKNDSYSGMVNDFIKSLMLLKLFNELDLIKGGVNMGLSKEEILNDLNSPAEKISFLAGVMSKNVLNIQWNKNRSNAFSKNLYDFNLDENRILNNILPKIYSKCDDYGIFYKEISDWIGDAIMELKHSDGWDLTNDETSFYFTYGYLVNQKFKNTEKETTSIFDQEYDNMGD